MVDTTADGGGLANVLASDAAPKSKPVILTLMSGGYKTVIPFTVTITFQQITSTAMAALRKRNAGS